MIELEVLVEVQEDFINALNALSCLEFVDDEKIIDHYFYDPLRKGLKPNTNGKTFESLRIREQSNGVKLTYKQDVYNGDVWQYSDENEMNIDSSKQMEKILLNLGMKKLLTINNYRRYYQYKDYEIILEKVKDLGVFIEVEYKGKIKAMDVTDKRKNILEFIKKLDIKVSPELNAGKPELYIKKHNLKFQ